MLMSPINSTPRSGAAQCLGGPVVARIACGAGAGEPFLYAWLATRRSGITILASIAGTAIESVTIRFQKQRCE